MNELRKKENQIQSGERISSPRAQRGIKELVRNALHGLGQRRTPQAAQDFRLPRFAFLLAIDLSPGEEVPSLLVVSLTHSRWAPQRHAGYLGQRWAMGLLLIEQWHHAHSPSDTLQSSQHPAAVATLLLALS